MTNSQVSRNGVTLPARTGGIAAIGLTVWFTLVAANGIAYAQGDEPVTLAPQTLEAVPLDSGGDGNSGDAQDIDPATGWSATTTPSAVLGAGDESIEINVLQTLGADMAGVLNGENGGFSPDLWRGTPRVTVDRLFDIMPVHTSSPAMRSLMRRIFLTQAIPPEGDSVAALEDGGFIARRLELLAAMGDVDAVEELLAITPGRETNERLIRIETGIHLMHGDFVRACALVQGPGAEITEDYWQKLLIFCEVLSGAHAEAQLGLSLLREVGVEDGIYSQMLDAMMAGEVPVLEDISGLTPLHVGIVRASRARLGPDVVEQLPPTILAAIAANPDLDDAERLNAAEQAAVTGVLSIGELRGLYESVVFGEEALKNPLSTVEELAGPQARALLYQVAVLQTVDGARAEVASIALESARNAGLYAVTAQAFNDVIKLVPPRTDLIWFSGHAVRALVIAADTQAASGWLGLLRVNATLSEEAASTLAQLVPVMRLAGIDDELLFGSGGVNAWRLSDAGRPGSRERAVLFYSLLESLGLPVASSAWDDLGYGAETFMDADAEVLEVAASPMLPDAVLWQRLARAARAGKTGETALLALAALGDAGTSGAHPLAMSHVVQTMTLAGLASEARSLAVEAALAGGL